MSNPWIVTIVGGFGVSFISYFIYLELDKSFSDQQQAADVVATVAKATNQGSYLAMNRLHQLKFNQDYELITGDRVRLTEEKIVSEEQVGNTIIVDAIQTATVYRADGLIGSVEFVSGDPVYTRSGCGGTLRLGFVRERWNAVQSHLDPWSLSYTVDGATSC